MANKKPAAVSMEHDYETEQDLRHLTQAHRIKQDPKRHKKALDYARQRIKEMSDATAVSPTDPMADPSMAS